MSKANKMERYDRRCNECQCEKCAYIRDGVYLLLRAGKVVVIFCVVAPALMLLFAILSFLPAAFESDAYNSDISHEEYRHDWDRNNDILQSNIDDLLSQIQGLEQGRTT